MGIRGVDEEKGLMRRGEEREGYLRSFPRQRRGVISPRRVADHQHVFAVIILYIDCLFWIFIIFIVIIIIVVVITIVIAIFFFSFYATNRFVTPGFVGFFGFLESVDDALELVAPVRWVEKSEPGRRL